MMMRYQGIPVQICFNKEDLGSQADKQVLKETYELAGYPVHFTQAITGEGREEIRTLLQGKTTTVAGPSGVGKSSLINGLQDHTTMETGAISQKIGRGKHTTRHSELIPIGGDSFIMDTPGFSTLYLEGWEKEDLKYYYPEFEAYFEHCRFNGCNHLSEPDCAVKEAVAAGKISSERYENYKLFYEELASQRRY